MNGTQRKINPPDVVQALVAQWLPLAERHARQMQKRFAWSGTPEDHISNVNLALLQAARTFNGTKSQFPNWLKWWVKGTAYPRSGPGRVAQRAATHISIDAIEAHDEAPVSRHSREYLQTEHTPATALEIQQQNDLTPTAVAVYLKMRRASECRALMYAYVLLRVCQDDWTLDAVGLKIGLSRERVRQIVFNLRRYIQDREDIPRCTSDETHHAHNFTPAAIEKARTLDKMFSKRYRRTPGAVTCTP